MLLVSSPSAGKESGAGEAEESGVWRCLEKIVLVVGPIYHIRRHGHAVIPDFFF